MLSLSVQVVSNITIEGKGREGKGKEGKLLLLTEDSLHSEILGTGGVGLNGG